MSEFNITTEVSVDFERRNIIFNNELIEVPKKISGRKPWGFLHMLIQAKGRILTYQVLEDSDIWPEDHGAGIDHRSSLKIWSSEFNKIFGKRIIKCDRGIGYYIELNNYNLSCTSSNDNPSFSHSLETAIRDASLNNTVELYNSGFETFSLYEYLLNSTTNRLWIYGRKNKKIFDRSFETLFSELAPKIKDNTFSLRILFLDPTQSAETLNKAQKKIAFTSAINQCIIDAYEQLSINNIPFNSVCRFYENIRNDAIIIADDIVFYRNIHFDSTGCPEHLTNSDFFIAPLSSSTGNYYKDIFESTWSESKNIDIRNLYGI